MAEIVEHDSVAFAAEQTRTCLLCNGPTKRAGTCYYAGRERELLVCGNNPQCVHDVRDPDIETFVMRDYPVEFVDMGGRLQPVQPGGDFD